jgi:hypothetical protein
MAGAIGGCGSRTLAQFNKAVLEFLAAAASTE